MRDANEKRLKILMLGPYPSKPDFIDGGVTAVVTYLSQALAARADIDLYGARIASESPTTSNCEGFGYPMFDIPKGPFGLTSCYNAQRRRLRELIKTIAPDVIHAQGADLPGYLAVNSGLPAMVTIHGMIGEDARYKTALKARLRGMLTSWFIEMPTVRAAKSLVLISPYVAGYYGKRISGQVFNIANPVSHAYFDVRRNPQRGRMLYAGRVIPLKGVIELVRAVAAIPESLNPRLIIAGALTDSAYVEAVRKTIVETNKEHRFELRGLLGEADLLREFELAQGLVLPSFQESAPMVIQQAMAAGIPVVASRICGVPYQIQEGVSGFMVEPGDVDGLRVRLMSLLADPSLATRLGDNARDAARKNYMASVVAQATVDAYRSILSRAAA